MFLRSAQPARQLARRSLHSSSTLLQSIPSSLEVRLRDGLKAAMKAKDRPAANCLKSVLAEITNAAKAGPNPNEPASDGAVMTAVRKAIANRREAAMSYAPSAPSSHPEHHAALISEIDLLQSYLPAAPTGEAITRLVSQVIDALSDEARMNKGAVGMVMKGVMEKLGEAAAAVDRKELGKMVGELLKAK